MYELIDRYIEKLITKSTPENPLWNIEQIRHGKSRIGIILMDV